MNNNLQVAFRMLQEKFGSHSAAACNLGINRDHYCAMRNGRANIPLRTAEYILLKAAEVKVACENCSTFIQAPPSTLAPPPSQQEQRP